MANETHNIQETQPIANEPFDGIDLEDTASNRATTMDLISEMILRDEEENEEQQMSTQNESMVNISIGTGVMCESLKREKPGTVIVKKDKAKKLTHGEIMRIRIAKETPEERAKRLDYLAEYRRKQREMKMAGTVPVKKDKGKKLTNSEIMKIRIAKETPEQRAKRLAYLVEYNRKKRERESSEDREKRLKTEAERMRKKLASETLERREQRLKANGECKKRRRERETHEERAKRLGALAEIVRKQREAETPEEREKRRKAWAEYLRNRLARETPEQREKRRKCQAECMKKKRMRQTPAEREKRKKYHAEYFRRKPKRVEHRKDESNDGSSDGTTTENTNSETPKEQVKFIGAITEYKRKLRVRETAAERRKRLKANAESRRKTLEAEQEEKLRKKRCGDKKRVDDAESKRKKLEMNQDKKLRRKRCCAKKRVNKIPEQTTIIEPTHEKILMDEEECVGQQSLQHEHVVTISPETVFMCENLEREAVKKRQHVWGRKLCLQSQTSEKTNKTTTLHITDVRSLSGDTYIENYETDDESLPLSRNEEPLSPAAYYPQVIMLSSNEFDRKLLSRAIVRLERCDLPTLIEREKLEKVNEMDQDEKLRQDVTIDENKHCRSITDDLPAIKSNSANYVIIWRVHQVLKTPAERETFHKVEAERHQQANYTPEQKEKRRLHRNAKQKLCYERRMRLRLANETPEEREKRFLDNKIKHKVQYERKKQKRRAPDILEEKAQYHKGEAKSHPNTTVNEIPEESELLLDSPSTTESKKPAKVNETPVTVGNLEPNFDLGITEEDLGILKDTKTKEIQ